jgi:hypothetical protein
MFEVYNADNRIENTEKKIKELEIRNTKLNQDSEDLLTELNVSPDQLSTFIKDKSNFNDQNWEVLQTQRIELEQKLDTEIKSVRDPIKTQQSIKERRVDHQWLFVR